MLAYLQNVQDCLTRQEDMKIYSLLSQQTHNSWVIEAYIIKRFKCLKESCTLSVN